MPYSFTSPIIHFDSCNQFHVHMYISHWGAWRTVPQSRNHLRLLRILCTLSRCHGTPHPPRPHAPNHLRSSPTSSAYTLVSLQCTLHKLAQPCHSCHQTKLGSMSNFPRLSPYVSGRRLFVFFSICHICLMHFH